MVSVFRIHVPSDLLSCSHGVAEFLFGKLSESAQFSQKDLVIWIALAHVELPGGLVRDCNQVLGVEVEVFVQESVLLFLPDGLSEDCIGLYLVGLAF